MLLHAFINIILTESTRPPEHVYSVGGGDAVSGGATLVLAPPDCMLLDLITCNMHMPVCCKLVHLQAEGKDLASSGLGLFVGLVQL